MSAQVQGGDDGAAPGSTDRLSFGVKSGRLGPALATDILMDPRLRTISLCALGAFILIKSHEEALQPIAYDVRLGCTALGLTPRQFDTVIAELRSPPGAYASMPLISIEDGFLRAMPFGKPIRSRTQAVRVAAANMRWARSAAAKGMDQARQTLQPAQIPDGLHAADVHDAAGVPGAAGDPAGPAVPQGQLFTGLEPTPGTRGRKPPTPYYDIQRLFNQCCPSLPTIKEPCHWSAKRKHDLDLRWESHPCLQWWEEIFKRVEESDFLCGRATSSQFKASFDWMLSPSNLQKIDEGNYKNRRGTARRPLFGQGPGQFEVGSYGGHEVNTQAPWLQDVSLDDAKAA